MQFPLRLTDEYYSDGSLACPVCGFGCTHIDRVAVAARKEDDQATPITVDAITGYVTKGGMNTVPAGAMVGEGRRHRIALLGACESGHQFAIVFTQHKGATYVEVLSQEWRAVGGAQ